MNNEFNSYLLFGSIIAIILAISLHFQQKNEFMLKMAERGYEQKVVENKIIWVKVKE